MLCDAPQRMYADVPRRPLNHLVCHLVFLPREGFYPSGSSSFRGGRRSVGAVLAINTAPTERRPPSIPFEHVELAREWPLVSSGHQPVPYRVVADVLPFRLVTVATAQLG